MVQCQALCYSTLYNKFSSKYSQKTHHSSPLRQVMGCILWVKSLICPTPVDFVVYLISAIMNHVIKRFYCIISVNIAAVLNLLLVLLFHNILERRSFKEKWHIMWRPLVISNSYVFQKRGLLLGEAFLPVPFFVHIIISYLAPVVFFFFGSTSAESVWNKRETYDICKFQNSSYVFHITSFVPCRCQNIPERIIFKQQLFANDDKFQVVIWCHMAESPTGICRSRSMLAYGIISE